MASPLMRSDFIICRWEETLVLLSLSWISLRGLLILLASDYCDALELSPDIL